MEPDTGKKKKKQFRCREKIVVGGAKSRGWLGGQCYLCRVRKELGTWHLALSHPKDRVTVAQAKVSWPGKRRHTSAFLSALKLA